MASSAPSSSRCSRNIRPKSWPAWSRLEPREELMNDQTLVLKSVTGVDVELQIAGPGSRSFAFIIDWHIRLIFALIWFITAITALGLWGQGLLRVFDASWQIVLMPPLII